jgi:hypothetical protein
VSSTPTPAHGSDEPTATTAPEGFDGSGPAVTDRKPGLLPESDPFTGILPSGEADSAATASAAPPAPAAPSSPSTAPAVPPIEPIRRTGPSVPTVVWGALLALVAAAVISHQVSTVDLNLGLSGPLVLLGAGAALVVWGIAGIGRARRR